MSAVPALALAAALVSGPLAAPAAADWTATGCVESVSSSHAPGRILFRLGDDARPDECPAPRPLGIGGGQATKRERYDFGLHQLRDLALAVARGERRTAGGAGCRAAWLRPAPARGPGEPGAPAAGPDCPPLPASSEPVRPAEAGAASAGAASTGPSDRWRCRTRVAEVLRYDPGRTLLFRTTASPGACVTQRHLDWRGAPESRGTRPSSDPDARRANQRATLWLLVLAQLESRLVVLTGRSCEVDGLALWNRSLPAGDPGRCEGLPAPEASR